MPLMGFDEYMVQSRALTEVVKNTINAHSSSRGNVAQS